MGREVFKNKYEIIRDTDASIEPLPRKCVVDGKEGIFIKWCEEDKIYIDSDNIYVKLEKLKQLIEEQHEYGFIGPGFMHIKVKHTYGLVEFNDGTVGMVKPTDVRFIVEENRGQFV